MSYTVLARKYRSQSFDDVIGQEPIARTLKNAIKSGRVAHAFLFVGTRGVGKTTMARILAKALNCHSFDGPSTTPCGKCPSCIAVNLGEDIDVVEIDGASNNGVDAVRQLRENAAYRPAASRYKIYIIDEVHMLSTGAFNALLKILEEPPTHVKFIFATTEPNKVLATIQSRCQRFDFNNINPRQIAEHLKSVLQQEKITFEDELVLQVARMANGSMRDGLSLLDRLISTGIEPLSVALMEEFLGCPNSEKIYNLVADIGKSDASAALKDVDSLINSGLNEVQIVDALIDTMRDLMVLKSAGSETELLILTADQRKRAGELVADFDIAGLVYNITSLEKLRWTLKNSETARALLEATVLRFALSEHFLNIDSLLSGTGGASVKKKLTTADSTNQTADSQPQAGQDLSGITDTQSVVAQWEEILAAISAELGKGTAVILRAAKVKSFGDGILSLSFSQANEVSKQMCQQNERLEAVEKLLSRLLKRPLSVKLELEQTAGAEKNKNDNGLSEIELKNQIAKDPSVRLVMMEFGAQIVDSKIESL